MLQEETHMHVGGNDIYLTQTSHKRKRSDVEITQCACQDLFRLCKAGKRNICVLYAHVLL